MNFLLLVSMLSIFEGEVRARAAQEGIPAPSVVVTSYQDEGGEIWAWVGPCAVGFDCDEVIFIRQDVLDTMGAPTMKVIALHEVLHLKFHDNVGPRTDAQMLQCHQRIWKWMEGKLDEVTLIGYEAERQWWKRRHRRASK